MLYDARHRRIGGEGASRHGSMLVSDIPTLKISNVVTPCTHNPLGVKGCGEAGAIGSPAAYMNALTDALGVRDVAMPATAERVWAAAARHLS